MLDEKRTEAVTIRFRPTLRGMIEASRQERGQSLVEWLERAALRELGAPEVVQSSSD